MKAIRICVDSTAKIYDPSAQLEICETDNYTGVKTRWKDGEFKRFNKSQYNAFLIEFLIKGPDFNSLEEGQVLIKEYEDDPPTETEATEPIDATSEAKKTVKDLYNKIFQRQGSAQ